MKYQKYDIVLVDFPFTDLSASKKRPAVVINALEGNNVIVCQITTKKHTLAKYEIILNKQDCEGDIHFNSFIYADLIATLHHNVIERKIGNIKNVKVMSAVDEKLQQILLSKN